MFLREIIRDSDAFLLQRFYPFLQFRDAWPMMWWQLEGTTRNCIFFKIITLEITHFLPRRSFPEGVYNLASFSYKIAAPEDIVLYSAIGSTAGKCNIMGFWHTSNLNDDGPSSLVPGTSFSVKANDANICGDTCSAQAPCVFNSTDPTAQGTQLITPPSSASSPWRNGRNPLKDFVGSDSRLKDADYKNYPDLQMLPSIAGIYTKIIYILSVLNN